MDNYRIISSGKKPTVLIEAVYERPDDYDKGKWIKVVNKKRIKNRQRLARRNKEKKEELLRNLKEKKIEERKKTELWYNETSWQYKILTNQYTFDDNKTVLEKYNLLELGENYNKAKNNYKKNGVFGKLMRIITKEEWEKIKEEIMELKK